MLTFKFIRYFFCLISFYTVSIRAEIVETKTLCELSKTISDLDKNSLVIFDIDFTLFSYSSGTIDFGKYNYKKAIENYIREHNGERAEKKIKERANSVFGELVSKSKFYPTDPNIMVILDGLEKLNVKFMLFTARDWNNDKKYTPGDLESAGFTLEKINNNPVYIGQIVKSASEGRHGFGFEKNILYSIRNNSLVKRSKGQIFLDFYNLIDFKFKKIVFIDDDENNVTDFVSSVESEELEVSGIWFQKYTPKRERQLSSDEIDQIVKVCGNNWWDL